MEALKNLIGAGSSNTTEENTQSTSADAATTGPGSHLKQFSDHHASTGTSTETRQDVNPASKQAAQVATGDFKGTPVPATNSSLLHSQDAQTAIGHNQASQEVSSEAKPLQQDDALESGAGGASGLAVKHGDNPFFSAGTTSGHAPHGPHQDASLPASTAQSTVDPSAATDSAELGRGDGGHSGLAGTHLGSTVADSSSDTAPHDALAGQRQEPHQDSHTVRDTAIGAGALGAVGAGLAGAGTKHSSDHADTHVPGAFPPTPSDISRGQTPGALPTATQQGSSNINEITSPRTGAPAPALGSSGLTSTTSRHQESSILPGASSTTAPQAGDTGNLSSSNVNPVTEPDAHFNKTDDSHNVRNAALGAGAAGIGGAGLATLAHRPHEQSTDTAARSFPLSGDGPHQTSTANSLDPALGDNSKLEDASIHHSSGGISKLEAASTHHSSGGGAEQADRAHAPSSAAAVPVSHGLSSSSQEQSSGSAIPATASKYESPATTTTLPSTATEKHDTHHGRNAALGAGAAMGVGAGTAALVAGRGDHQTDFQDQRAAQPQHATATHQNPVATSTHHDATHHDKSHHDKEHKVKHLFEKDHKDKHHHEKDHKDKHHHEKDHEDKSHTKEVAAGAGAAGLAAHEHKKYKDEESTTAKSSGHGATFDAENPAPHTTGPHKHDWMNKLDPRVKSHPKPEATPSTTSKSESHAGRDAAIVGGLGTAAAVGTTQHAGQTRFTEADTDQHGKPITRSAEHAPATLDALHGAPHHTGKDEASAKHHQTETGTGSSHAGLDAAVVGGLGTAAAVGAGHHHTSKNETPDKHDHTGTASDSSHLGRDTAVAGGLGTAAATSGHHHTGKDELSDKHHHTEAGTGSSHLGRDAAVAGGLGTAAAVGHHHDGKTGLTEADTDQHGRPIDRGGAHGPSALGTGTSHHTGDDLSNKPHPVESGTESSHLGRNAAIAGGLGTAAAVGASHHHDHQNDLTETNKNQHGSLISDDSKHGHSGLGASHGVSHQTGSASSTIPHGNSGLESTQQRQTFASAPVTGDDSTRREIPHDGIQSDPTRDTSSSVATGAATGLATGAALSHGSHPHEQTTTGSHDQYGHALHGDNNPTYAPESQHKLADSKLDTTHSEGDAKTTSLTTHDRADDSQIPTSTTNEASTFDGAGKTTAGTFSSHGLGGDSTVQSHGHHTTALDTHGHRKLHKDPPGGTGVPKDSSARQEIVQEGKQEIHSDTGVANPSGTATGSQ